jgi:hypothetical protein
MEEDCGGSQGLSWAVEPRRERAREREREREFSMCTMVYPKVSGLAAWSENYK